MFSDELEMLIEAAIADGEITDKERSILHKRASSEGVDPDELDMIIDARILKMRTSDVQLQNEGECIVTSASKEESALKKFLNTLKEIEGTTYTDIKRSFWELEESMTAEQQKHKATINAIRNFYIPQDKGELVELISFLKPYTTKGFLGTGYYEEKIANAYKDRYKEACNKALTLFPEDPEINSIINGPKKKGLFGRLFGK
ncbi:MAG: hypothetical protein K2H60_12990 [Muribaculaceae bacterium]|nr:hypothetical protein [Muribaculaceae bacterium]